MHEHFLLTMPTRASDGVVADIAPFKGASTMGRRFPFLVSRRSGETR
jgi:hypothetical protein